MNDRITSSPRRLPSCLDIRILPDNVMHRIIVQPHLCLLVWLHRSATRTLPSKNRTPFSGLSPLTLIAFPAADMPAWMTANTYHPSSACRPSHGISNRQMSSMVEKFIDPPQTAPADGYLPKSAMISTVHVPSIRQYALSSTGNQQMPVPPSSADIEVNAGR